MEKSGSSIRLSCGVCRKYFRYSDLIIEPSWNGKWLDYKSPCCNSISWAEVKELARPDKYLFRMTHDIR